MRYDSPKDVAGACKGFVSQGFTMLKLHQTDVASVRAAREAVGLDVELMLDVNCPWTPAEAIAMARQLEPYRLLWFEEPVWPPEDYTGLAEVARATATPIALGENESTLYGFREIVDAKAHTVRLRRVGMNSSWSPVMRRWLSNVRALANQMKNPLFWLAF
jgi:L-alanine-DL-glutamate epimerase-like enolase superfamily enzyme